MAVEEYTAFFPYRSKTLKQNTSAISFKISLLGGHSYNLFTEIVKTFTLLLFFALGLTFLTM